MLKKLKRIARKIPFAKRLYKMVRKKRPDLKQSTTNKKLANDKIANLKPRGNLSAKQVAELTPAERREYYIKRFVPHRVRLEVSTVCQLRCAGCGFQKGDNDDLGRGFLSVENFKKFCDMNPFIREIEISNYGEPFLNPNLVEMLYIAKEKGISMLCLNGTNFNTVSDEQIHALVDTGFKEISLSIDGASQETYKKYRIGGDFDCVMENVRKLQAYKKEKTASCQNLDGNIF